MVWPAQAAEAARNLNNPAGAGSMQYRPSRMRTPQLGGGAPGARPNDEGGAGAAREPPPVAGGDELGGGYTPGYQPVFSGEGAGPSAAAPPPDTLSSFMNEIEAAAPPRTSGSNGGGGTPPRTAAGPGPSRFSTSGSGSGNSNGVAPAGASPVASLAPSPSLTGRRPRRSGLGSGPVAEAAEASDAAADRLVSGVSSVAGDWARLLKAGMGPLLAGPLLAQVRAERAQDRKGCARAAVLRRGRGAPGGVGWDERADLECVRCCL